MHIFGDIMLEDCIDILQAEQKLSAKLGFFYLIGEIEFSTSDMNILADFIKEAITPDIRLGTEFLENQAPSCLAFYLVWEGIMSYHGGDYWTAVRERVGIPDPNWQNRWGQFFTEFLEKKKLPQFDIPRAQKNLSQILTHGGIPNYCLPDFFDKVLYPLINGLIDPNNKEQIHHELAKWRRNNEEIENINKEISYQKTFKAEVRDKHKRLEDLISLDNQLQEVAVIKDELRKIESLSNLYSGDPESFRHKKLDEIKQNEVALEDMELIQLACEEFSEIYSRIFLFNEQIIKQIEQVRETLSAIESETKLNAEIIQDTLNKESSRIGERQQKSEYFMEILSNQLKEHKHEIQEIQMAINREILELDGNLTALGDGNLDVGVQKVKSREKLRRDLQNIQMKLKDDYPNLNELQQELHDYGLQGIGNDALVFKMEAYKSKLENVDDMISEYKDILQHQTQDFSNVDEPVLRYLLYGGDSAERFLILSMEMLNRAIAGGTISSEELGLTERVVEAFKQWWESKNLSGPGPTGEVVKAPILSFDSGLMELKVLFPAQMLNELKGDISVRLSASDQGQALHEQKLRVYRQGIGYQTEVYEYILNIPADEYHLELLHGGESINKWAIPGINSDTPYMAFDYRTGKYLAKDQFRRNRLMLITPRRMTISPSGIIMEESNLYGSWGSYKYALLDLSGLDQISFRDASGPDKEFSIPISSDDATQIELIDYSASRFCNSEEDPVYFGRLPIISMRSVDKLGDWSISIDPAKGSYPRGYRSYRFSELLDPIYEQINRSIRLPLSNEKLLGPNAFGRFVVRVKGPYRSCEDFSFCFIPEIRESFDESIYLPSVDNESLTAQALIRFGNNLEFKPYPPAQITSESDSSCCIQVGLNHNYIKGTIYYNTQEGFSKLPLTISVPKLYWRIQGLPNAMHSSWCDRICEVDLDDWDLSKELYLDIRTPTFLNGVVWLKCGPHKTSKKLSNGISRLNLMEFNDTLRSGISDGTFTIDISDTPPEIGIRDVPIFRVIKAFIIKSVDYAVIRNGKDHCLQVKWEEDGFASQNRVVRLWSIDDPDSQPVAEETTEMGLCEVLVSNLSHGKYRIEVDVADIEDLWAMGASFPLEAKNNTRDIVIAPTIYCKQCDYSCSTEWSMINHIRKEHSNEEFINSFVKHLSYDELRQVYPSLSLPERIYKCLYCGSKYFASVSDLEKHQEKNCPKVDREFGDKGKINIKFSFVSNVDEIRGQYIHDLPYVYRCVIDGFHFEEYNINKILEHLLKEHKDRLYWKK